jgi:7,8-dihydropterin-6-yl-methyl-4-(beta-D-ribofuranosyl)aminobenzene 5'-phosphate synthase
MKIALEPVDGAEITTLVDNSIDVFLPDTGPAKRFGTARRDDYPTVPARTLEPGKLADWPRAEHGFSALITLQKNGRARRVLFDSGVSPTGLVENMSRLDLSPKDLEAIVLSHGHFDHCTGMDGIIQSLGRPNLPVIIHPDFWLRRRVIVPGREPIEIPSTSKAALLGAGFEIVEEQQPSFLLDGSLLVTGEVDRTTAFEKGFPVHQAFRENGWQPDPLILDDQAAVLHVRDKGLVVLTGCGHAGIVNIVRYAQRLTGVERVHAVLGGFHLGGPLFEPIIPDICKALGEIGPQFIVPAHCTGWVAMHALADTLPDAFIPNSVGTRFEF